MREGGACMREWGSERVGACGKGVRACGNGVQKGWVHAGRGFSEGGCMRDGGSGACSEKVGTCEKAQGFKLVHAGWGFRCMLREGGYMREGPGLQVHAGRGFREGGCTR